MKFDSRKSEWDRVRPVDPWSVGKKQCNHPSHNPPMHLYIPPGSTYLHTCPGCQIQYELFGAPSYLY